MGYYAVVSGYLDFRNPLPEDRMKSVLSMLRDVGWYEALASKDRRTIDFWSDDKYYYQTGELLNAIALGFPVCGGKVECAGEDGCHWVFRFVPGLNHGSFEEHTGSIAYDDELPVREDDRAEFIGQIIDVFDDFLDDKEICVPNDEKPEDGGEGTANLYGTDYGNLQIGIEAVLRNWKILK